MELVSERAGVLRELAAIRSRQAEKRAAGLVDVGRSLLGGLARSGRSAGSWAGRQTMHAGEGLLRAVKGTGPLRPKASPTAPAFQAGQTAGGYLKGVADRAVGEMAGGLGSAQVAARQAARRTGGLLSRNLARATGAWAHINPANLPRVVGDAVGRGTAGSVRPVRALGQAAQGLGRVTTGVLNAPGTILGAAVPKFQGLARYVAEPTRAAMLYGGGVAPWLGGGYMAMRRGKVIDHSPRLDNVVQTVTQTPIPTVGRMVGFDPRRDLNAEIRDAAVPELEQVGGGVVDTIAGG